MLSVVSLIVDILIFLPLWSDRRQDVTSAVVYLLGLALCPNMWLALEKVPQDVEKNVYYLGFGWNVL